MLDTPSSSSTKDHIPDWCKKLFEDGQKDPDESPGMHVLMVTLDRKKNVLMRGAFMYVGQDTERLTGVCEGCGKVDHCFVEVKGRTLDATHDMHDMIVDKGNKFELKLYGLKILDILLRG